MPLQAGLPQAQDPTIGLSAQHDRNMLDNAQRYMQSLMSLYERQNNPQVSDYDVAAAIAKYTPIADKTVGGIMGNIAAQFPGGGYGDSGTAVNLARNRAHEVLGFLGSALGMDQDAWKTKASLQPNMTDFMRMGAGMMPNLGSYMGSVRGGNTFQNPSAIGAANSMGLGGRNAGLETPSATGSTIGGSIGTAMNAATGAAGGNVNLTPGRENPYRTRSGINVGQQTRRPPRSFGTLGGRP